MLSGVLKGEEDDESKLRDQIEHTGLYDDVDRSQARPSGCRKPRALQVACLVKGEIPDAHSDEDGHKHVCAQRKNKARQTRWNQRAGSHWQSRVYA
jgi:hypothetical protein